VCAHLNTYDSDWDDSKELVCSEKFGHMSLITLFFPEANLNNNNAMEVNKYMSALYVHSQEVGKPLV
jgi:hypothetical protein